MKKIMSAALCVLALSFLTGAVGSQSNPLIPYSWLEGEFRVALMNEIDTGVAQYRSATLARLMSRLSGGLPLTPPDNDGYEYTFSDGNTVVSLNTGQSLIVPQGTAFAVYSEAAQFTLERGDLLDLTAGTALLTVRASEPGASTAVSQHRSYLLPEASHGFLLATEPMQVAVDGWYAIDTGEHAVFKDVMKLDWFYNAVDHVYTNGYFRGTADDAFTPEGEMTRAMFVTVLYRFAGQPLSATSQPEPSPYADTSTEPSPYSDTNSEPSPYSDISTEPSPYSDTNSEPSPYSDISTEPSPYFDSSTEPSQYSDTNTEPSPYTDTSTEPSPYSDTNAEPMTEPDAPPATDVVDSSLYYYDAVRWGVSNGIIRGYDDGSFQPDAPVTREQMAALMYRYAQYAQFVLGGTPGDENLAEGFPDWGDVSDYAQDAFKWACSNNVIRGSDGLLLPGSTATRAQVAQVIVNLSLLAELQ